MENDMHTLIWYFYIETDQLISTRRPDLMIKKRTCKLLDFAVVPNHRVKLKESEEKNIYLDLARELKKLRNMIYNNYTNSNWCFWYSHRRIDKGTGELGNKR